MFTNGYQNGQGYFIFGHTPKRMTGQQISQFYLSPRCLTVVRTHFRLSIDKSVKDTHPKTVVVVPVVRVVVVPVGHARVVPIVVPRTARET
jgi:hypothetical protein